MRRADGFARARAALGLGALLAAFAAAAQDPPYKDA
jgi:hypothetical protein